MPEAKPVQPGSDRGAMHRNAPLGQQDIADLVERQARTHDRKHLIQVANPAGFRLQLHHVVHEFRRYPETPRVRNRARTNGAPIAHPDGRGLSHKRYHPHPQLS